MIKRLKQVRDDRLEIARIISQAPESRVSIIKGLYPEYFSRDERGTLERISDLNTSYAKWVEDYGINKEWIGAFPTVDIYYNYVRYCTENKIESMDKSLFYDTLEKDFHLSEEISA